jgi:hypothetical protein
MTIKDINTIIETLCPNDEDYEKPIISPKYLRQELEQLALEQEPCDDCISRKEVIKLMEWGWKKGIFPIYQIIALPPVTPAEKVGQINTEVLDKIRAEIEAKCCITVGRENDGAITLHDVFEIIDKYKTESEE